MPGTLSSVGISSSSSGGSGRRGSAAFDQGDVEAPKKPGILASIGKAVTGIPGGLFQLGSDLVRLPVLGGAAIAEGDFGERFPAIFGMGKGFQTTGRHLNPLDIGDTIEDYREDPVGMLLNDVGNIATVGSGGLAGIGKAGLLAGTAGGRTASIAARVEQVAKAGNKVADLPLAPYRFAGTRALEGVGRWAEKGLDAGSSSALRQGLVRLSPNAKALNAAVRLGSAKENAAGLSGLADEEAGVLRQDLHRQTAEDVARLPFARRLKSPGLDEAGNPLPVEVPEGFKTLERASRGQLGRSNVVAETALPESLAGVVDRHFKDPNDLPGARMLHQVLGPTNRAYRMLRMDLNPGWAIGQAPGNAVMTAMQSSTPVGDVAQYIRRVIDGKVVDDPRVVKSGAAAVQDDINLDAGSGSKIDRALSTAEGFAKKTRMAALAERLDNASRSAFYERRIAEGHSPDVARDMTLRSLGEFDASGNVQRAYVAPSIPFYKWSREIVRMTGHLAEDHPVRFANMANLGMQSEQRQGELAPGERTVDGGFLVPYGQSGDTFKGTIFGIGKKMGPVPKMVAMLGTGKSMSSGKDLLAGQKFGESNTPGLHNLGPALGTVARSIPQGRLYNAVDGDDRYTTPQEAGISYFTSIDVSHSPTQAQLEKEKAARAEKRAKNAQDAKIRRLTEAAVQGR